MIAKEFLLQAYKTDRYIERMTERVRLLRDFTKKISPDLSDIPCDHIQNIYQLEDVTIKIAGLEKTIADCNERLIETKKMIDEVIKLLDNPTYRLLLELRYLCYMQWLDIAHVLGYELRYTYKLHKKALQQVETKQNLEMVAPILVSSL